VFLDPYGFHGRSTKLPESLFFKSIFKVSESLNNLSLRYQYIGIKTLFFKNIMLFIDILGNSYFRDNRLYIQAVFKKMGVGHIEGTRSPSFIRFIRVVLRVTLVRQKMQNDSECTFSSSFIA
jgi:hypothetical protein